MTPEDRVDEALRAWIRAGAGEGSKTFLADSIRAAENDAIKGVRATLAPIIADGRATEEWAGRYDGDIARSIKDLLDGIEAALSN